MLVRADSVRRRLAELAGDPAGLLDLPPGIYSPQLVVDRNRLQRNLVRMAAFAGKRGVSLAPHAKTHKIPEIARLQMDAGASALTVAKLGEAEAFHDAGFNRFVLAYPMASTDKTRRAVRLARSAEIVFGVDSAASAEHSVELLGERTR
jgi:D-serine deaminase-like pyridoxal phosphate-dependent protein